MRPTARHQELIRAGTHLAAIAIIRQRTHAALVKSEQRYRNLTDQAADSFFVHDERGKLVEVNRRACDSLGYTREELLQMNFTDVEQEFDPPALEKMLRQLKPGQARTLVGKHRRKDGTEFPWRSGWVRWKRMGGNCSIHWPGTSRIGNARRTRSKCSARWWTA
jgi:PAS domain S-box-containing protein